MDFAVKTLGFASENAAIFTPVSRDLQIKCSSDENPSSSPETAIARHEHDSTKDRLGIITPSDKDNIVCHADSESSNCNKNRVMSNITDNSTTRSTLIDAGATVSCRDVTSPTGNDKAMKNVNVKTMAKTGSRGNAPFEKDPNVLQNDAKEAGDDESGNVISEIPINFVTLRTIFMKRVGQHKGLSRNRVYSFTDVTSSSSHPNAPDEE